MSNWVQRKFLKSDNSWKNLAIFYNWWKQFLKIKFSLNFPIHLFWLHVNAFETTNFWRTKSIPKWLCTTYCMLWNRRMIIALMSKKRWAQLVRQAVSLELNLLPGALVMHLSQQTSVSFPTSSFIIAFCFSCSRKLCKSALIEGSMASAPALKP